MTTTAEDRTVQTITIECDDCGHTYTVPTTLREDQSALRHAALVDTIGALVDAQHERECPDLARVGSRP